MTRVFHSTLPLPWSSATSLPSSWPRYTLPSPSATPRLVQPQQTVVIFGLSWAWYTHFVAPVVALMAKTSSAPVIV